MAFNYRTLFPRTAEVAYLDTAAEGLPAPACAEAVQRYSRPDLGTPGRKEFHSIEAEALDRAAHLLGTGPENVTFLSSASDALNILANSIDWQTGDEVIISDLEFPSNVLPWLRLRQKSGHCFARPRRHLPLGDTGRERFAENASDFPQSGQL